MPRFKHGCSHPRTPEFGAWIGIRSRCNNPNSRLYKYYGGRGIRVCKRWNDFLTFLSDVGNRPTEFHSIDRINNNGNYEPRNVRWATKSEQMENTRYTIKMKYNGVEMSLKSYCKKIGLSYGTAKSRKYRGERSLEKITEIPHGKR